MAGRRHGYGGALASSLDLASSLLLHQQEQAEARRQQAAKLAVKFKADMAMEEYKRTGAYTDPLTNQVVGTPRATTPPPGLEPYEYDPSTGVTKFRHLSPLDQTRQDILDTSQQVNRLQEQVPQQVARIQATPLSAFTPDIISGQRPQLAQRATDIIQAPLLQAQNRLAGLQEQGRMIGLRSDIESQTIDPAILDRIQQLRQQGMPNEQIAGFLAEKGIDPASYGL